ncbi:redoxin domain-containing protein [Candidatus Kaiserbacteria bacterium]|nr:MAG: redoxin domain-containing protein [Candidatus Kaiserbacteria bacterium]
MNAKQLITLALVAALIVGAIAYLQSKKIPVDVAALAAEAEIVIPELTTSEKAEKYDRAREITQPAGFINTEAFNLADVVGKKVILLDIWTYSCINCQRTLPYITAWDDKYKDEGLLIVGIHSPEFEFEKDIENVQTAVEKFGINYPVVLDNDFGTWHAYRNSYWPRKYLIDIDGFVVYDHIGEGAYDETEAKIKELLAERAQKLGEVVDLTGRVDTITVPEAIADTVPRSPEVYFGAWRNSTFGNGSPGMLGGYELERPATFVRDIFYLTGAWNIYQQYAENAKKDARIIYKYSGDKVFMVASSKSGATIRLLQDGEPIGAAAGADIDENGRVEVKEEQLYKLVDNPDGAAEHTLEIIIEDPGLEIFTFTFG